MLNKLARIDAGPAQLLLALALAYHNNNHPNGSRAALPGRRRLACHWRPVAPDGRLECYWQLDPADETEAQRQKA